MNEIKVFLVEDEMVIRRGIKNSIDWEKEGYIFCGEASDGELAYPMIIKEKPDILITDIRMPFMDGLELCKLVKKELPNIKILILSGYDEFDYAKEAIRLGVTEYLLKPISSGKLLEALNGVSESIRREKEDKDLVRKYMEEMRENTEHEKQKFFEQMIAGNLSMADALETGKKYEMNLSAGMYNLLLFRFTLGEENRKSGELLGEAEYAIEKLTERLEYVFEFQRGVEGWAFLLMADNEEQMSERVKELSKDLEEIMKNYSTIAYFGGIGQPVARLRELEESFREAERALAARFTMELNRIISVEDIGGNAQSAMMMGLNVKKTKFKAYVLDGLLAGCGGFLFCLNSCSGFVEQAKGLEMDAISASVIGGTLLSGGVGTPFGTVFGVLIKGTISSLITTQGTLSSWWVRIALSALLCFFIVLQSIIGSMKKKN